MSDIRKIQDSPGWVKNMDNKAVLNSNLEALNQHKMNKQKLVEFNNMKTQIETLKTDINALQSGLSEIKELLTILVKNK